MLFNGNGRIFTLTGFDGVGKTTHSKLITKYFEDEHGASGISMYDVRNTERYETLSDLKQYYDMFKSYDVINSRFYLYSPHNYAIQQRVMHEDDIFNKTALVESVAKIASEDAKKWYDFVIGPLVEEGKIFVFDRYYFDEVAYRSLYGISPDWIAELYTEIPKPDGAFLLHLSVEEVIARNLSREDSKTQLYRNREKLIQLYSNLERIALNENMFIVDSSDDIETNHAKFIEQISI